MTKKKIGIDCWFACSNEIRGIGKVNLEFLKNLQNTITTHHFFLFVPRIDGFFKKLQNDKKFSIIQTSKNYFFHEQILIPYLCMTKKIDILHSFANTSPIFLRKSCKRIINIHDIIFLEESIFHQIKNRKFGALYRRIIIHFLKKTPNLKILTPSDYTKNRVKSFNISDNVVRIYNGIFISKYNKIPLTSEEFMTNNFILVLGAMDERKNTWNMIKSYMNSRLIDKNIKLKVVGVQSIKKFCKKYSVSNEQLRNNGIYLSTYVPDDTLIKLYQRCKVFMYVSLNEGFGLPIIEALISGARVITSNTTSCKEIAGSHAVLVNPKNIKEITKALINVTLDPTFIKKNNQSWFEQFKWESIILEYLSQYET